MPTCSRTPAQVGLPATIEHRKRPEGGGGGGARAVAETVQHFITAMDSLKLNLVAVDQICPILSDLISSMSKIATLPPEFAPKTKAKVRTRRKGPFASRLLQLQLRRPGLPGGPGVEAGVYCLGSHTWGCQGCTLATAEPERATLPTLLKHYKTPSPPVLFLLCQGWYSRLYQQPASYELSEDEVRQLLFDLESSYNEFISTIK